MRTNGRSNGNYSLLSISPFVYALRSCAHRWRYEYAIYVQSVVCTNEIENRIYATWTQTLPSCLVSVWPSSPHRLDSIVFFVTLFLGIDIRWVALVAKRLMNTAASSSRKWCEYCFALCMTYELRGTKSDWKPIQRERKTRPKVHQNRMPTTMRLDWINGRCAVCHTTRHFIYKKTKCQSNWIMKSIILFCTRHELFVASHTSMDVDGNVVVHDTRSSLWDCRRRVIAVLSPSNRSFAHHSRCSFDVAPHDRHGELWPASFDAPKFWTEHTWWKRIIFPIVDPLHKYLTKSSHRTDEWRLSSLASVTK